MTKAQRLTVRLSEIRQRLNELLGIDSRNDEQQAEMEKLTGEVGKLEPELRAAIAAEPDPDTAVGDPPDDDPETRERLELRGKARLHRYVESAVTGKGVDGAEAEYAAAEGCPGLVPITMLGPTVEELQAEHARRETRAVTPAPADGDLPHTYAPIVPAIFDRSIAPWLGVEMPTVGTGIQSFPVLSTSVTGGMKGEDAAAENTAGAFTVTDADPRRLTGAFTIRKEDIAKMAGLEAALQGNLGSVLSDALDGQLLNGNGTRPNLNGLFQQLTDATAPAANAETFARYSAAFASHVDGLYATVPTEVRMLVGPHTMRHMAGTFATNEDATSAYAHLMAAFGGVRASRRIGDPASNVQQAVVRRGNPAGDRVAVAPVWMGLELIRDVYGDNASKGQVTVTATALVGGVVLLRSGVFVEDSFRLAA